MKTCLRIALIAIMSFALVIVGTGTGNTEQKTTYSGFLEDYPSFEPDKDRPGALIYRKAGTSLKDYSKVIMDPVEIWYAPDCKYKGIKPDELKILADAFRAAIVSELEPDYPVVSKSGPGVLGIRMAAIGDNMSLQDATIEAELLDSQSNERLGALIDRQHKKGSVLGKLSAVQKGGASWEEIEKTLKFYAKRLGRPGRKLKKL